MKYYFVFWSFFSQGNYGTGITGWYIQNDILSQEKIIQFNLDWYKWNHTKISIDSIKPVSKEEYYSAWNVSRKFTAKVEGYYEVVNK